MQWQHLIKIEERPVEKEDQKKGEREKIILTKLYCVHVLICKNKPIMYNYNINKNTVKFTIFKQKVKGQKMIFQANTSKNKTNKTGKNALTFTKQT